MHSCINTALWDFAWFLCSHRYQCVIFDVKYWKWAALNLSFQTILHVCLICFCMSISLVITSVRWCSVSDRDKSCASSIILFIISFLSTSACFITQCSFSMTSQDWMLSCVIWTRCRRVWSFVDIIAFTVFREVWLSLYTLYIFSWHSRFSVATLRKLIQSERNFIDQSDSTLHQRQVYTLHHVIARIYST